MSRLYVNIDELRERCRKGETIRSKIFDDLNRIEDDLKRLQDELKRREGDMNESGDDMNGLLDSMNRHERNLQASDGCIGAVSAEEIALLNEEIKELRVAAENITAVCDYDRYAAERYTAVAERIESMTGGIRL